MPNQWQQHPRGKAGQELKTLALGVVIIGIIVQLLFPNFFSSILSNINLTAPGIDSDTPTATTATSVPITSGYPIPNSPTSSVALTSGYWELFVANGTLQQFSISAEDHAFVKSLIQRDTGSKTIKIFLVDNGQIQEYLVSNEAYSIISNMATINGRTSNSSTSTAPTPTTPATTPPATEISETLTVSNPSTTGFTVTLSPALSGLTISNFTLVDGSGNPVTLTNATTANGGATYAISAALSAGQTYSLTATNVGYTFGTAQNVKIP